MRLRAVTSTRRSVTLSWEGEAGKCPFVVQMKDRLLGWTTVYSGWRTEVEVGGLGPGDCFQFRIQEEDGNWSSSLYAATKDEAVPSAQLFRAVRNGHTVNAKKILSQRPSIVNVPNKYSQSPMELAVANNDVCMVTLLLNSGADISRTEIGSWRTPLMIAALWGHTEIGKLLIERGCSWEDQDRNGMTAVHYAAENSHLDFLQFAVEDGADVTAKDIFGWSPLMRAVTLKASLEVVEYLLLNERDVNDVDNTGQTVLMLAVLSGRPDVVQLVASKKVNLSVKNIYGHTAHDLAVSSSVKDIRKISKLLQTGSEDTRSVKKSGKSAWSWSDRHRDH